MGLLRKKKSPDTIDFTMLQKRGILQRASKMAAVSYTQSPEILDMGGTATSTTQPNAAAPDLGFLGSLASIGAESASSAGGRVTGIDSHIATLRIKIDDVEYKLERLVDRLALIESKLEVFERKVIG